MALAMAVVVGWQFGVTWLYKKQGWQLPSEKTPQVATTQPVTPATTQPSPGAVAATSPTTSPATTGALRVVAETGQPRPVALGSAEEKDKSYALQLNLDPTGAGLKAVVLNDFKVSTEDPRPYVFQEPYARFVTQSRPLGTRSVTVDGQTFDLSNVTWRLIDQGTADGAAHATYAVDLAADAGPVAQVYKRFTVFERGGGAKPGSAGFEVGVQYGFRNLSGAPLKVKSTFNGPTLPPPEIPRGPDRQVITGYKEADHNAIVVHAHPVEAFEPEEPNKDLLQDDKKRRMVWGGGASVYFDAILLPTESNGAAPAGYLAAARAEGLDVGDDTEAKDRLIATVFETTEFTVPAGGEVAIPLNAYFGPRWRKVLNANFYAAYPRAYNRTLVIASGMCAVCTFQWLIDLLVRMLNWFHWLWFGWMGKGDWGLAIITLVIIVRAVLHPVTKRSQISMMKMGKMGPEMEKIRKKYGDDKEAMSRAMWEFQKSQGVTPILGCLPMFLQMPIWIALWSSLQSTFELRQSPFLWGFTWIDDLAKPDALIAWTPIKLFWGIQISSLNILPIILAGVFWLQQKLQPKPAAMTPEQEQQQKMMQWMTLLFPVFLYGGPSGLNIYILTSTTIGIIESHIIRKHIREREEAEKSGRVIVDARPTRSSKRKDKDRRDPDEPKKKGGFWGMLAELQARAEEVRRQAERKGGK